jgi:hypothetical protein
MRPELTVLIKARAKIADPAKWGKGIRTINGGHRSPETCCAAEAIQDVETRTGIRRAAYAAIGRAIGTERGVTVPIVEWNDAPERTHAEVLAAFDRAIKGAE